MDIKTSNTPALPPQVIVLSSNSVKNENVNDRALLKKLTSVQNTAKIFELLCENFSRIRNQSPAYKKILPNVLSKLTSSDMTRLLSEDKGDIAGSKKNDTLAMVKDLLIKRKFDDKNAEQIFSKLRDGKIIQKNVPSQLNRIDTDASKINAMSKNKDILTSTMLQEIVKGINKEKLSAGTKKKLASIEYQLSKNRAPADGGDKEKRIISYSNKEDAALKKLIFRDFEESHPILKNKKEVKENILNTLTDSNVKNNGAMRYDAKLEETVAGLLCIHEMNEIIGGDMKKTTIVKPRDGYCDFHVELFKNGEKIKFGIDPFRVSENADFEKTFLHHTNSEKNNGGNFPVIGVACFESGKEASQNEIILGLLDKHRDKNLHMATYSPQHGCKLIEFPTYKYDQSMA